MRHLHQRIMERLPCFPRSLFYPTCLIYSPFSIILGYPEAVCPFFIKTHARNDRPWTSYNNESSIQRYRIHLLIRTIIMHIERGNRVNWQYNYKTVLHLDLCTFMARNYYLLFCRKKEYATMSPNINDLRLVRGILLLYSFNSWVVDQPHGRSVASRSPVASIYAHAPVRTFTAEILKNIYIFFYFPKKHVFYHLIGMKDIFFAVQCLCVSISFNVLLFHNFCWCHLPSFFQKTLYSHRQY